MKNLNSNTDSAVTTSFDYEYREFVSALYNHSSDPVLLALGLASEAGEVAGLVEKVANQGHEPDIEKLTSELGDIEFYLNAIYALLDTTGTRIRRANMAKLKNRYPTGKFSIKDSIARKDQEW